VSLFGRIAWTGLGLLVLAFGLGVFFWRPANERAFVRRTADLRRDAERDFSAIAMSKVSDAMEFATREAFFADEQRVRAIQDLPFELYTDRDGRPHPRRLREALRDVVSDPALTGGQKHAAVRAELLERTRRDVDARLEKLRAARADAAARHAELATWRTLAAWGGILLVVLAGWAFVLDRIVVRPVREVTAAVGRFGAGERGIRLAPGGAAELSALDRAFNETAAAVERAEAENAELRSQLEEKVKERTAALVRAARASTAGTMAGGIAHEFNNLLGGVLGCAEAALDEEPRPEVREALEMIRKTAGRGVGITQALLRATRAEPERAPCDPVELMEEALAEVRPPKGVEVDRDFAPGATLHADAAMLRQVLANLIRNAVDAMGGEGRLGLRVAPGLLEVTDSGPGIEESVREILFEPFVTTRRGSREGAGLGLFLADRLIGAHGGRIEVGTGPEGGASFRVFVSE